MSNRQIEPDKEELTAIEKWLKQRVHCSACGKLRPVGFVTTATRCKACRKRQASKLRAQQREHVAQIADLLESQIPPAEEQVDFSEPDAESEINPRNVHNFIVCPNPNCGYRGKGVRRQDGDITILILLLLLALLPGIIYAMFCRRSYLVCPSCVMKVREIH